MLKRNLAERKRDGKISYSVMFWLFFFGSIIGFILEGLWQILKKGRWENHSSTILGPFCIIYGFAAMLLYIISKYYGNKHVLILFAVFAIFGSVLEFAASIFQEIVFGSVSWNYKKQIFNIAGRVSMKMSIIWGLLGVMFAKLLYPFFNFILRNMNGPVWNFMCILLTVFMVFNLAVTSIAVLRWGERVTDGTPPSNQVEAFFDKNYGNETMVGMFTNMEFVEK